MGIADGSTPKQQDDEATASPGHAAQAMISSCAEAFEQATADTTPVDVMAAATHSTCQPGSSTPALLLAALQPGQQLQVARLHAACRMLLLRGGCIVSETAGLQPDTAAAAAECFAGAESVPSASLEEDRQADSAYIAER